jgi:hypothetical protein
VTWKMAAWLLPYVGAWVALSTYATAAVTR